MYLSKIADFTYSWNKHKNLKKSEIYAGPGSYIHKISGKAKKYFFFTNVREYAGMKLFKMQLQKDSNPIKFIELLVIGGIRFYEQ